MSFMIGVLLFIAIVLITGLAFYIYMMWNRSVMNSAMIDLYAILSFESVILDEVLEKIMRSRSHFLKRYFNSSYFRMISEFELQQCGLGVEYLRHRMLLNLLYRMEKENMVEMTYEVCSLEWLEANAFRLRAVPPLILNEWYERARIVASTTELPEPIIDRHLKKMLLEIAVFVRKLPKGRSTPRRQNQQFVGKLQPI
jgi:hypothetical protein